jgi:hypothetical protein
MLSHMFDIASWGSGWPPLRQAWEGKAGADVMRTVIALSIGLAACSTQQIANIQYRHSRVVMVVTAVCQTDALAQPILVPLSAAVATAVVPTSAPIVAGAVALDTNVVHPAIVKACAAVKATPVAAIPASIRIISYDLRV